MADQRQGVLPGWWLGEQDGRPYEPYITPERWDKELRNAGFSGTDSVIYDDDLPYQINANIVSSAAEVISCSREVAILCGADISPIARQVEALLTKAGFSIVFTHFGQMPPVDRDIISLVDLRAPFFDNISAEKLAAFQRYIGNLQSAGILWVTRSAQIGCKDPRYSQVIGIARTIRSELSVDFATFEIDTVDSSALDALLEVFDKFQKRREYADLDPDWELALSSGVIQIPRYHPISVSQQLSTTSLGELPKKLEIGKFGLLRSLRWVQDQAISLADGQVEVEPRAVGMNFKVC